MKTENKDTLVRKSTMSREAVKPRSITRTFIVPSLLVITLLWGCRKEQEYVPPPPPLVTVSLPIHQTVIDYDRFTGTTEAVESVEIRARVEGYLESILFEDGARVEKGDLLFVIDPKPFQAKMDLAEADLLLDQAELKLCETTLQRKERALEDNAISELEVIEARAQHDKAAAAVEAARAAVETARLELSYTRIQAPIRGIIGKNLVDVGNLVGAGERTLMADLVRDDPIYVYFTVSEKEYLTYRPKDHSHQTPTNGNGKTKVSLGLAHESGYPHEGHVDFVDNRVDVDTGTIQIRAIFPNADRFLLPGLFARIKTPKSQPHTALLVPERSLGADQLGRYLLVAAEDDVVIYKSVQVGDKIGNLRVIESGITEQDRVIVNGIQRARPGAKVTAMEDRDKQESDRQSSTVSEKGGLDD